MADNEDVIGRRDPRRHLALKGRQAARRDQSARCRTALVWHVAEEQPSTRTAGSGEPAG
jgi:hypothetical protein